MGHIHLGRLPKTLRWRGVVRLLDEAPDDVPSVARATVAASTGRLRALGGDPSVGFCFWLLTRISSASRSADFRADLADLGLSVRDSPSTLSFIAQVTDRTGSELARHPESGPFAELASLALRRALSETVGQEGRSLFDTSIQDLQSAFRRHSTPEAFGLMARRFFGDFLSRTLRFFVERELSNHVGPGHALANVRDSHEFASALDLYCRQSARILERFAPEWYSKHHWEARGRISREEAQGFVAVALRKLRSELNRPAG
jgi:hypothetical protein